MYYYLRVGRYTLEKSVTERVDGDYGFAIPAHILSFYRNSVSTLLAATRRRYFIDPMTYVFATDPTVMKRADQADEVEEGPENFKRSYRKLLENYDLDLTSSLSAGPLGPERFSEDTNLKRFVEQTLDLQKDFASRRSPMSKYEALLGDAEDTPRAPDFLLTPYFYFGDPSDRWYAICKRMADHAKKSARDLPIYAALCIDKRLLGNAALIDQIISDFDGFDGYVTLISGFDEEKESVENLRSLKVFFTRLRAKYQKPIINLYGSFFSATLGKVGLESFSSGLCIHHSRDVNMPYATGRAIVRFYVTALHSKLSESEAKTFLVEYDFVKDCSCEFCTELERILRPVVGKEARTRVVDTVFGERGQVMSGTLVHFLRNRLREITLVNKQTDNTALLQELAADKSTCDERRYVDLHSTAHLDRWILAHRQ